MRDVREEIYVTGTVCANRKGLPMPPSINKKQTDKSDQITDQYSSVLKTVKCWGNIVFHLISRTTTNVYICYGQNKILLAGR